MNISWSDKICHKEVFWRVGERRSVMPIINERQNVWLAILGVMGIFSVVIEGRMDGRRPPERQRIGILDRIRNGGPYILVEKDLPAGRTQDIIHS